MNDAFDKWRPGPAGDVAMTPAALKRQRDTLLNQLSDLVILGKLGWNKGDTYAEVSIEAIRKAERLCNRIRKQELAKEKS